MQQQITKVQLESDSFQWGQIDYQLQLITGKSSLKLINVYKYEDKGSQSQALDYKSTQDSIINVTDFSKQYAKKIIQKTIPLQDVIFYCGHMNIHKHLAHPHKIFTFLISKVSLGKIGTPKDDVSSCESIFIEPTNNEDVFQYNYFIRSHYQYSVKYQVNFTASEDKQFKLNDFECSNCQNRIPSLYCKTEKLFFCDQCCNEHHRTKLMQNHQLQLINKINTLANCKNHGRKLEYYCLKCSKYLCDHCTQKGVHHQNHEHPYKSVSFLYQQCKNNIQILPKKPKQKLQSLMINLNVKRKQLQENYKLVKQEIVEKYQTAIQVLQTIYHQKCQTLNSCQIQLKMINDKIQWSKAFLIFQEKSLKPIHYFQSQKKFEQQITKLKISEFQGIFLTKADIKLQGELFVGTKDTVDRYSKKSALFSNSQQQKQKTVSIKHSRVLDENKNIFQRSLLKFNPKAQKPKLGDLSLLLQNSNLHFFQINSTK